MFDFQKNLKSSTKGFFLFSNPRISMDVLKKTILEMQLPEQRCLLKSCDIFLIEVEKAVLVLFFFW